MADDPETASKAAPKKRARFADPDSEDEQAAFAKEVDESLETKGRRGRVKTEGYDTDSTDDGEGVVYSRRKKGGRGGGEDGEGADDDDEDMFAVASDDEKKKDTANGANREPKWMQLGDIDGQEFGPGEDGEEDEDSVSESEPEDEDDRIRRSKAGMGYEFTKFNMKEELEEGRLADDGTYVRTVDQFATHDKWLESVDEREMKKARRAKRKADKTEREKIRQEEGQGVKGPKGQAELERELVTLLKPGETVLETLARLGKEKKKREAATGAPKKRKPRESRTEETKPEAPPPSDIDRITAISSKLLPSLPDIYSTTYEAILRSVRRSGIVPEDWRPPIPTYEYKWAVDGAGDGVFGPFGEEELRGWFEADFFGPGGDKVLVRRGGANDWSTWDEVFV